MRSTTTLEQTGKAPAAAERPDRPDELAQPGEPRAPASAPGSSRRSVLGRAVGALAATLGAILGLPALRFLATPLGFGDEANTWLVLCRSDQVAAGPFVLAKYERPYRGFRQTGLVWVQRREAGLFAISASCTHLGCNVTWDPRQAKMLCPCHGGVYTADGEVISGPSRKPLLTLEIREKDGFIWIKPGRRRR